MGSTVSSPSGSGQSPAAKRYLVHFWLKIASSDSNFKGTFTENVVFSLFTTNNATLLGDTNANILRHVISCCCHSLCNLLSVVILWSQVTAPTAVSM